MAEPYQGSQQTEDLAGAEVLIRGLTGGDKDADIYALTEFNVTTEPRAQRRLPIVNGGTITKTGSKGQVTGTVTVYVHDSAGQDKIDYSYDNQSKAVLTFKTFGERLTGDDGIVLATGADLFGVAADGTLSNANLIAKLAALTGAGELLRGCKIVVSASTTTAINGNYFIERVEFADDDTVSRVQIAAEREARMNWPFHGDAIAEDDSGTIHLYDRFDQVWTFTGVAQNPVGPGTVTASTDGDNVPTSTISFALDGEGRKAATIPSA